MSGGSPNTWQASTSVAFGVTPREYTHWNSCMLHRASSGNTDELISATRYSMEYQSEFLSDSNPPKPQARFQMYTGGDSSWSRWALDLGTTYTVKVEISQSASHAYTYNNVTFKFYLWLY